MIWKFFFPFIILLGIVSSRSIKRNATEDCFIEAAHTCSTLLDEMRNTIGSSSSIHHSSPTCVNIRKVCSIHYVKCYKGPWLDILKTCTFADETKSTVNTVPDMTITVTWPTIRTTPVPVITTRVTSPITTTSWTTAPSVTTTHVPTAAPTTTAPTTKAPTLPPTTTTIPTTMAPTTKASTTTASTLPPTTTTAPTMAPTTMTTTLPPTTTTIPTTMAPTTKAPTLPPPTTAPTTVAPTTMAPTTMAPTTMTTTLPPTTTTIPTTMAPTTIEPTLPEVVIVVSPWCQQQIAATGDTYSVNILSEILYMGQFLPFQDACRDLNSHIPINDSLEVVRRHCSETEAYDVKLIFEKMRRARDCPPY
uniref:DUF19 domain-containing protein n=1 Tax=Caenorhabditis tropicalis TaxID=1561998 RepID=A0A1I7UWC7_9PELO